jgi:tetratricopeptide (TPR) repeat protein
MVVRSRIVALWLLAIVLVAPVARAASPEDKTKAREHFQNGLVHYDLGEFGEALSQFKDAYRMVQDPAFLFNIAQCHRRLGQNVEALEFYRNFLRRSPNAANRGEVEHRIQEIEREIQSAHPASRPTPTPAPSTGKEAVPPVAPVGSAREGAPSRPNPPPPAASPVDTAPPAPSPTSTSTSAPATLDLSAAPASKPEPATGAFYTRWWFWTSVGAVVVGALAIGFAVSRRGEIGDCRDLSAAMCRTVGP